MSADAFRNNVVLLTGASRGIGREMAMQLADQGASLVLAARNESDLLKVTGKTIGYAIRAEEILGKLCSADYQLLGFRT